MADTMTGMLVEFHESFGHLISEHPTADIGDDVVELRKTLITEEFRELVGYYDEIGDYHEGALDTGDLAQVAKEAADLLYVVVGTLVSFGVNAEQAVTEVHTSNMTKLGPDGKPVRREDGKVLKGDNYRSPNMEKFVSEQGSLRASLAPRRRRGW